MMIAFSKRACQHYLVSGNGVMLVVTFLLRWCRWFFCPAFDQQAVPAQNLALVPAEIKRLVLSLGRPETAAENAVVFTQLGLDPSWDYYPFPCFPGA